MRKILFLALLLLSGCGRASEVIDCTNGTAAADVGSSDVDTFAEVQAFGALPQGGAVTLPDITFTVTTETTTATVACPAGVTQVVFVF